MSILIAIWRVAHVQNLLLGWVGLPVVIFFSSRFLRVLENILHEASHFGLPTSKNRNIYIGSIVAKILNTDFCLYRTEHLLHHKYIGESKDPDLRPKKKFLRGKTSPMDILLRSLWPDYVPTYLKPLMTLRNTLVVTLLLFISLMLIVSNFYSFVGLFVFNGLVSYLLGLQWYRFISDSFDHGGLLENTTLELRSRNHSIHYFVDWIIFPWNDSFHLGHHLNPNIPILSLNKKTSKRTSLFW